MGRPAPKPQMRQREEFRERLAAARRALGRTVSTTEEEMQTLAPHESREIGEDAASSMAGSVLAQLDGQERHELDEIDAAQARLEAGTFGTCESCHQAIPLARLRAMPTARYCAICQVQMEQQERPGGARTRRRT